VRKAETASLCTQNWCTFNQGQLWKAFQPQRDTSANLTIWSGSRWEVETARMRLPWYGPLAIHNNIAKRFAAAYHGHHRELRTMFQGMYDASTPQHLRILRTCAKAREGALPPVDGGSNILPLHSSLWPGRTISLGHMNTHPHLATKTGGRVAQVASSMSSA
jgi:hypothetical protein